MTRAFLVFCLSGFGVHHTERRWLLPLEDRLQGGPESSKREKLIALVFGEPVAPACWPTMRRVRKAPHVECVVGSSFLIPFVYGWNMRHCTPNARGGSIRTLVDSRRLVRRL